MKKIIILLLGVLFLLTFASCESKIEMPVAGRCYIYKYYGTTDYCYYMFLAGKNYGKGYKTLRVNKKSYDHDFYYTYDNGNIYMYNDKKKTDLWETATYHDSYIIIDGDVFEEN